MLGIYNTSDLCTWFSLSLHGPTGKQGVVKYGSFKYDDGTQYIGDWNDKGQKHGMGHMLLPDGTRYDGGFDSGLFNGLGVIAFPDGARSVVVIIYSIAVKWKLKWCDT